MSPSGTDSSSDAERFERLVNAVTDYAIYMLDPAGRVVTRRWRCSTANPSISSSPTW